MIVQGKVKWFSKEKGYGYIVGEDGAEHYFNVRDIKGTDLPQNGDCVSFESSRGKKGPRASSVVITEKSDHHAANRTDDRAVCQHCGKKMIPRIVTSGGVPIHSLCPFCGKTYKKFKACFIATAVYGDPYASEVIALRRFRDETLASSAIGQKFIMVYYKVSPPIAAFLSRHKGIASFVKIFLDILARRNDR